MAAFWREEVTASVATRLNFGHRRVGVFNLPGLHAKRGAGASPRGPRNLLTERTPRQADLAACPEGAGQIIN
jgi:hypothetical protein